MIDTAKAIRTLQAINARENVNNQPAILRVNTKPAKVHNKSGKGFRLLVTVEGVNAAITIWDRDVPAFRELAVTAPTDDSGALLIPVLITASTDDDWYNVTARPLVLVTDAADVFE